MEVAVAAEGLVADRARVGIADGATAWVGIADRAGAWVGIGAS